MDAETVAGTLVGCGTPQGPAELEVPGAGPWGPGSPTSDELWDGLAGCGGRRSPAAGARQEGAPAALPALGRDKGRSPGPSPAAAAAAARAPKTARRGKAPGATPAPPAAAWLLGARGRARPGGGGGISKRGAPSSLPRGGGGGDGWRRRESAAAGPGPWRPRTARCCLCS